VPTCSGASGGSPGTADPGEPLNQQRSASFCRQTIDRQPEQPPNQQRSASASTTAARRAARLGGGFASRLQAICKRMKLARWCGSSLSAPGWPRLFRLVISPRRPCVLQRTSFPRIAFGNNNNGFAAFRLRPTAPPPTTALVFSLIFTSTAALLLRR